MTTFSFKRKHCAYFLISPWASEGFGKDQLWFPKQFLCLISGPKFEMQEESSVSSAWLSIVTVLHGP